MRQRPNLYPWLRGGLATLAGSAAVALSAVAVNYDPFLRPVNYKKLAVCVRAMGNDLYDWQSAPPECSDFRGYLPDGNVSGSLSDSTDLAATVHDADVIRSEAAPAFMIGIGYLMTGAAYAATDSAHNRRRRRAAGNRHSRLTEEA